MSPMQRFDLVNVPLDGWNLLEANAGTGKTYSMCGLFLRLMLERGLSHDQIVTITFTRAATGELRTRLLQTLLAARGHLTEAEDAVSNVDAAEDPVRQICRPFRGDDQALQRIDRALRSFDLAPVLTIHSLCQRVLTESSLTSGFNVDATVVDQQREVLGDIVEQAWVDHLATLSGPLVAQLQSMDRRKLSGDVDRLLARPYAVIQAPELSDPGELAEALLVARKKAADIWEADREAIVSVLRDAAETFKKTSHSPERVDHSLSVMPAYLRFGLGGAELRDVSRLSQEKISSGTLQKAESVPEHPFFGALDRCVTLETTFVEAADLYRKNLPQLLLDDVRRRLDDWKRANHALTFDDLVQQLHGALKDDTVAKALVAQADGRYGALLVDEYQDTDPLQAEIFERLFGPMNVPVWRVGDPKQSLYGFRGADLHAYLATRAKTPNCYRLVQDWRAQPALIDTVNALFSSTEQPFVLPAIEFASAVAAPRTPLLLEIDDEPQSALTVWSVDTPGGSSRAAQSCASEIARLLSLADKGRAKLREGDALHNLEAQHLAVLVRSNAQAATMAEALAALGIASSRAGVESVFESAEAVELERLLHAVSQPARRERVAGALATRLLGFTAQDLYRWRNDEAEQDRWANRLRDWRQIWSDQGVYPLLLAVLRQVGVADRILPLPNGAAVMSNLLQLADLMESETGGGSHTLDDQLRWLNAERQHPSRSEDRIVRLDRDSQVVPIATVHRAKGAEYPVVFCPFLWRSSRHPQSFVEVHEDGQLVLDFGTAQAEARGAEQRRERISENARVAYVALTRAQAACFLPWSVDARSGTPESGLSHLLIPEHADTFGMPPGKRNYAALLERYLAGFQQAGARLVDEPERPLPRTAAPVYPTHRDPATRPTRRWQVSSYSRLFSGAAQDRDIDEQITTAAAPLELPEGSIAALPAGAQTGLMMHDLLENLPGFNAGPEEVQRLAAQYLQRYSLPLTYLDALASTVSLLLATPLGPDSMVLQQIAHHEELREMEFHLHTPQLEPAALWQVIRGSEPPAYFNSQTVRGYVHGYVDLIVCWQGRYWVIDYKSSRLGVTPADYGVPQLAADVALHDYDFQYHLYLLALDRHLDRCLPGYRYEEHIGGVLYLYLRGIDSAGHGVHYARPDKEVVARLRELLLK
ncbi:MAG: exodeoxyribonuclease V subunit beta [Pseudomonadota bacterium]